MLLCKNNVIVLIINKIKNPKNMSDLKINIRILMWHLQVNENWKFSILYNEYHKGLKHGWFEVCKFRIW